MLKKMLKSVLPIALVIAMLFSQSALAATVGIYELSGTEADIEAPITEGVKADDTFAVVVTGAQPNEMVTILIYEDVAQGETPANNTFDEGEVIRYIWQVDANGSGNATFTVSLPEGVTEGTKAVAIGTQNNTGSGYAATTAFAVVPNVVYYTVTFVDYNGTILKTEEIASGTAAEAPADPTREGYTFTGWDVAFDNITADTTVTANYVINSYEVVFVDWDGTELKKESVNHGAAATAPAAPAREGYDFTGWDVAFDNITTATTVTAQYAIKTYTVTFVGFGNTELKVETVEHGSAAEAPDAPAVEGYTFVGWDKTFANVTEDLTVTAQYDINKYNVTFLDKEGNQIGDVQVVEHGAAAEAPDAPAVEGYTFAGWDKTFANVTEDLTVTAQYDINKYNVTFLDKEGNQIGDVQVVEHGAAAEAPEAPVVEGYDFTGWSVEFDNITAATTVQATYTIKTFDVTFVGFGNTELKVETVEYGAAATAPEAPAVEGYTFMNWDVDFSSIKADTTVTANYVINSYEVVFVDWDGTELKKESVNHGAAATAPAAPAREGYDFTGWDVAFDNITTATTVTAQYAIKTYTITWIIEGNETTTTVDHGVVPEYVGTPTKDADAQYTYTFAGWTPDLVPATEDAEYTATFTETVNKYTVTWIVDGVSETEEYEYGQTPTHSDPVKEATAEKTFTFAGWTPAIDVVTGDVAYTATFTEAAREYTITWANEDGSVIDTDAVAYGETPVYTGETPVKAEDEENTYTFAGWTPAIDVVTGDATYTAVFDAVEIPKNVWTVKFDGEVQTVTKGESIKLEAAEKNGYQFVGWSNGTDFLPADYDYTPDANVEFTSVWVDITMKEGAAIRLDATNPGIRFTTLVDAANYTAIKGLDQNVKMGTLIATESALNRGNLLGSFTIDAINDCNAKLPDDEKIWAANVNAKYLYNDGKNGEDVDYRAVMIVKQPQTNKKVYTTKWVARSYIEVNYTNDTSDIFYAAEPMLRSLEYVADKVIEAGYKDADGKDLDDAAKAIINEYANTSAAE